jgi:type IV pilus assembly protein PilB
MSPRLPLEQALVQAGLFDPHQVQSATAHQRKWGGSLEHALVELGLASESALMPEVARHFGVTYVEIGSRAIPPEVVRLVPERLIRSRKVFPVALGTESRLGPLTLATTEPLNLDLLDEVAFVTGKTVRLALASDRDIGAAIERYLGVGPPG